MKAICGVCKKAKEVQLVSKWVSPNKFACIECILKLADNMTRNTKKEDK